MVEKIYPTFSKSDDGRRVTEERLSCLQEDVQKLRELLHHFLDPDEQVIDGVQKLLVAFSLCDKAVKS